LTDAQWSALGDWEQLRPESIRPEAVDARTSGFAVSHDEVIRGLRSVAVPLVIPGQLPAAVAVVFVASASDAAVIGARLADAASAIAAAMR
jgi:DNA-binding IclR family transcriptional regulator